MGFSEVPECILLPSRAWGGENILWWRDYVQCKQTLAEIWHQLVYTYTNVFVWGRADLLALLFFIITIALRNMRISSSLCKTWRQKNLIRYYESSHMTQYSPAINSIRQHYAPCLPSQSRMSCRPHGRSPGARTGRESFGPPRRRWSWRTRWRNKVSAAIYKSEVNGTKKYRVLWLNPCWQTRQSTPRTWGGVAAE